MAAPKDPGGRRRTSTCIPLRSWKLILLSPCAMMFINGGYFATYATDSARCASEQQAWPVTRISRSPTVSRPPRSEPGGGIVLKAGEERKVLGEFCRLHFGRVNQEAPADAPVVLDGLEQLLLMLLAHTRQGTDLSLPRQLLHSVHVANLIRAA